MSKNKFDTFKFNGSESALNIDEIKQESARRSKNAKIFGWIAFSIFIADVIVMSQTHPFHATDFFLALIGFMISGVIWILSMLMSIDSELRAIDPTDYPRLEVLITISEINRYIAEVNRQGRELTNLEFNALQLYSDEYEMHQSKSRIQAI